MHQLLSVWGALNMTIQRESSLSGKVMHAKSPSEGWALLKNRDGSDYSATARDIAKKDYEQLAMIIGESAGKYLARVKGLAAAIRYHGVVVDNKEICRRILIGLLPPPPPGLTPRVSFASLFFQSPFSACIPRQKWK